MKRLRNYINGQWVEAESSGYLPVEDPSTAAKLGEVPLSTPAEIDRAVAAAKAAFPEWSATPVARRCEPLYRLGERIRDQSEEIARQITEEMGKSLPDARAEMVMLGTTTKLAWKKAGQGFRVTIPAALREDPPCQHAWTIRVSPPAD